MAMVKPLDSVVTEVSRAFAQAIVERSGEMLSD